MTTQILAFSIRRVPLLVTISYDQDKRLFAFEGS